jgi:hypothetical protein
MLSLETAKKIGRKLGVDFRVISPAIFRKGMKIELEHGKKHRLTNVTNDDLLMTGKITVAHLMEFPNYYEELIEMEKRLKKQWKGYKKPRILVKSKGRK